MTEKPRQIPEESLHAYVDDFLGPAERQEVEAHLARNAEDAERVRSYRQQNATLRALGASLFKPDVPGVFLIRRRSWTSWQAVLAAAGVAALVLLGAATGWMGHGMMEPKEAAPDLAHLAAMAHDVYAKQKSHPVEVFADQKPHLDKWLSVCLNAPLVSPDLAQEGYQLVGGRLLSNEVGAAAMLMYQDAREQRIIVYVVRDAEMGKEHQAADSEKIGAVQTFYWKHGPLWYAVAGQLPDPMLRQVAHSIDRQIAQADLHRRETVAASTR